MALTAFSSHRLERLRTLTEVTRAIGQAGSLADVMDLAARGAAELLRAERAAVLLAGDDGRLTIRAAIGLPREVADRFGEPLDEAASERVARFLGQGRPGTFVGVPLVVQGSLAGLVAAIRGGEPADAEADEWLLAALADQVSSAMERERTAGSAAGRGAAAPAVLPAPYAGTSAGDRTLAVFGHDLRVPLNAIMVYGELLGAGMLGPITDRQEQAVDRIRTSASHLLRMVDGLLELVRLSAGTPELERTPVRVAGLMTDAATMVAPAAELLDTRIQVDADGQLLLEADPTRLRQVLINLMDNAIKYAPRGGVVRAAAGLHERDGEPWGRITVTDEGPGIPADEVEAIFEPFYRRPPPGERRAAGAGLGLAICRALVTAMNGRIEVDSRPGEETTFTIWLPVAGQP